MQGQGIDLFELRRKGSSSCLRVDHDPFDFSDGEGEEDLHPIPI